MFKSLSFRKKILLSQIIILILFFALLFPVIEKVASILVRNSLIESTSDLKNRLQKAGTEEELIESLKRQEYYTFFRMSLINDQGLVIYDTHMGRLLGPEFQPYFHTEHSEIKEAYRKGVGYVVSRSDTFGGRFAYVAETFPFQDKTYILRTAFPYEQILDLTSHFNLWENVPLCSPTRQQDNRLLMNILPLIYGFIILFAIGTYAFVYSLRATIQEKFHYSGAIGVERTFANTIQNEMYKLQKGENLNSAARTKSKKEEDAQFLSPRDKFNSKIYQKLNIKSLLRSEGNPALETLALSLIKNMYQATSIYTPGLEHEILETLIRNLKEHSTITNFEALLPNLSSENYPLF